MESAPKDQALRTSPAPRRRSALVFALLVGLVGTLGVGGVRWMRWRAAGTTAETPAGADAGPGAPSLVAPVTPLEPPVPVEPPSLGTAGAAAGSEVLRGLVRLAGRPVPGARITASGGAPPADSDAEGGFTIGGLRPGRYAVRAVGDDAAALIDAVQVPDPRGAPLVIELRPAPSLQGHVVDSAGHAVEGAEVTLGEGLVAPPPRGTRSDAAGAFRFAAVLPGRYFVTAAAPGYVTSGQPLKVSAAPPELRLVLGRAATVAGVVVDDEDHPVAGARVSVVRDGASVAGPRLSGAWGPAPLVEPAGELGVVRSPIPYPPLDGPLEAPAGDAAAASSRVPSGLASAALATGADGRFRAGGLAAGRVTVVASHAAFVDGRSAEVELPAGGEATVRVVLRRAMVVRGRVRDAGGAPVPGAELWLDGAIAAITDKKGRWELRRLPGPFDVEVRARGRARSPQHVDPAFRTGMGGEVDLTVGDAESRLSGLVVDTRGLPVAGARVTVETVGGAGGPGIPGSRTAAAGVTDGSGEFTIDGAPAGPLAVHVAHGEHLRASVVGVQPGDDVRVTLAAGGALEGEIVDGRGGVAAGSRVTVEDAGGERHPGAVDRGGRFRVGGCAPGPATLRAEAPGYMPAEAVIDLPAADRSGEVVLRDVRVTLAEAGLLTGTVRDRWGQSVAGAIVEAAGARTRTDGAGRFSLTPLPVGHLSLVVTAPDGLQLAERTFVEPGSGALPATHGRSPAKSIDVRFR